LPTSEACLQHASECPCLTCCTGPVLWQPRHASRQGRLDLQDFASGAGTCTLWSCSNSDCSSSATAAAAAASSHSWQQPRLWPPQQTRRSPTILPRPRRQQLRQHLSNWLQSGLHSKAAVVRLCQARPNPRPSLNLRPRCGSQYRAAPDRSSAFQAFSRPA
jgi:hypothetical protein